MCRSLCEEKSNPEDGKEFAENLWGTSFASLGRTLKVEENGDLSSDFSVLDMNPSTRKFEVRRLPCTGTNTCYNIFDIKLKSILEHVSTVFNHGVVIFSALFSY